MRIENFIQSFSILGGFGLTKKTKYLEHLYKCHGVMEEVAGHISYLVKVTDCKMIHGELPQINPKRWTHLTASAMAMLISPAPVWTQRRGVRLRTKQCPGIPGSAGHCGVSLRGSCFQSQRTCGAS